MGFQILRGQSVRWRMTMLSGQEPADMTGGAWCVAESSFLPANHPAFENNGAEAWMIWTPQQTANMKVGKRRLRMKFVQANGEVKIFPDIFVAVQ